MWDFAQGYAQLKTGNADFAKVYLERVKKAAETSKAVVPLPSGEASARNRRGNSGRGDSVERGRSALARSRRSSGPSPIEDELGYDEPEALPFAARHWLGAALLEAKRYADAERVYREELDDHPHNGWSLIGLQKALAGRGVTSAEVDADFAKSWSRADTWIRTSRF